jgi:Cu/Ag efflux protein CusF
MRKILLPLVITAALAAPSLALAAAQTTDGTIRAIDQKAMTVTLNDGEVFHLPPAYKVADLKAGAKVKVTWDKMGTLNQASTIVIEK